MFASRPIFGMIHLRPLPGAPLFAGSLDAVIEAALADARALAAGGCDGMVFENFGDRPFFNDGVPPETVAAMTRLIADVTREVALPFGEHGAGVHVDADERRPRRRSDGQRRRGGIAQHSQAERQ